MFDEIIGYKRGKEEELELSLQHLGNRNALSHWHTLICLQHDVNNVVSMQMCILSMVINYIS